MSELSELIKLNHKQFHAFSYSLDLKECFVFESGIASSDSKQLTENTHGMSAEILQVKITLSGQYMVIFIVRQGFISLTPQDGIMCLTHQ